jgi:hypothetical protein
MPIAQRVRAAWDCCECRFYRRAALLLIVLAILVWLAASQQ